MALPMTPVFTQTVGVGGATTVIFNNIPQFYTDLQIVFSARTSRTGVTGDNLQFWFNGDYTSTINSETMLYSDGTQALSYRESNLAYMKNTNFVAAAANTANTFGNGMFYIPNYSGSNFKQIISDSVAETNAVGTYMGLGAALWRSTSGITSISFQAQNAGPLVQYSTFSLYGILRAGA